MPFSALQYSLFAQYRVNGITFRLDQLVRLSQFMSWFPKQRSERMGCSDTVGPHVDELVLRCLCCVCEKCFTTLWVALETDTTSIYSTVAMNVCTAN